MNILLIDDDPLTLEFLRKGLESNGHVVTTAENGFNALCLLEDHRFDSIICDIFMPQISGLVVANIVSHYYGSAVPLLLMSSNKNIGQFIRTQLKPGYDFIQKPVSIPDLVYWINQKKTGGQYTLNNPN